MTLPVAHTIGEAFVEARRAHRSLNTSELHLLPHLIAHAGERDGDALALQIFDGAQQRVASGRVDEVHRTSIQEHMLRRWMARGQRGPQAIAEAITARKEQIAARAPNQQSREGDGLGM